MSRFIFRPHSVLAVLVCVFTLFCTNYAQSAASGPAPDPLSAVQNLIQSEKAFHFEIEVQHHPTKTGAGTPEVSGGGKFVVVAHYSDPYTGLVSRRGFVAESDPYKLPMPAAALSTTGKALQDRIAFGYSATSNTCWLARSGQETRYADGPLVPTLGFSQPSTGNSTRTLVSQTHDWILATMRLGIPGLVDIEVQDDKSGSFKLSSGVRKTFLYIFDSREITQLSVFDGKSVPEYVIDFADYRDWPFGKYPSSITRFRAGEAGKLVFDKRFLLKQFAWAPDTLAEDAFYPNTNFLTAVSNLPLPVVWEKSNGLFIIQGTNIVAVNHSLVTKDMGTGGGKWIRRLVIGIILIATTIGLLVIIRSKKQNQT